MTPITLDAIEAKQTEISKLIAQFKDQASRPTWLVLPQVDVQLYPGERYAGPVLDEAGNVLYHLVLMAQKPATKLNHQAAMDWAASIGGMLPTRQEQALLYANCKPHLKPEWHWSCETYKDDASYAWLCNFSYGLNKSYAGSAVAVRRV